MGKDRKSGAMLSINVVGVSDVLETLANDGALSLLIGKHGAQAISQVIAGAASVPEAWFRAKAKGIEGDQSARSTINDSLANHIASLAPNDQALVDRASIRWAGQAIREQENLEAIGAQATIELRDDPSTDEKPVSEDFLNRFIDTAGKASSEEMRLLFSRVLAGEIRQPGRFSLAALHLFSLMDQRLASLVERYASKVLSETYLLSMGAQAKGVGLQEMRTLESFGLVATGLSIPIQVASKKLTLTFPERIVLAHFENDGPVKLSVCLLTALGQEVFGLVAARASETVWTAHLEDMKSMSGVTQLQHCVAKRHENGLISDGPLNTYWQKS